MRKTVLIADPDAVFRARLATALLGRGVFTLEAADGRSAIASMVVGRVDAAVVSTELSYNGSNVFDVFAAQAEQWRVELLILCGHDGLFASEAVGTDRWRIVRREGAAVPDVVRAVCEMIGTSGPAVS